MGEVVASFFCMISILPPCALCMYCMTWLSHPVTGGTFRPASPIDKNLGTSFFGLINVSVVSRIPQQPQKKAEKSQKERKSRKKKQKHIKKNVKNPMATKATKNI